MIQAAKHHSEHPEILNLIVKCNIEFSIEIYRIDSPRLSELYICNSCTAVAKITDI